MTMNKIVLVTGSSEEDNIYFGNYYTRKRRGRLERVRNKRKKQFKKAKREAFKAYKKGKPGLAEKLGLIGDRKKAKYREL